MTVAWRHAPFFVAYEGQSLNLTPFGGRYPTKLMVNYFPTVPWENKAIGGISWTNLHASAPSRLHPFAYAADLTVLVMCGGQSDLYDESDTGATVYANMVACAQAATVAGFGYVIATTIPPSNIYTAGENTARTDANTLILADASAAFDAVVDVAAVPGLDDAGSANYADGLHWSDAGATLAAATVAPYLEAIPGFPAAA